MSKLQTASERITDEVSSWPAVTAGAGRHGEVAFKVSGREIGHLHGDHEAHFAFQNKSGISCSSRSASTTTRSFQAGPASAPADSRPATMSTT